MNIHFRVVFVLFLSRPLASVCVSDKLSFVPEFKSRASTLAIICLNTLGSEPRLCKDLINPMNTNVAVQTINDPGRKTVLKLCWNCNNADTARLKGRE